MNPPQIPRVIVPLGLAMSMLLAACGSGGEEATPTLTAEELQTQAVATFSAELTTTALAMPTDTPTATETAAPTASATALATNTPSTVATSSGVIPTSSCYGLAFVSDVTIPDNTKMTPGQEFTKTWRVRNNGSCAWEEGFRFRFTGGEALDGSTVTLDEVVQAGEEVEFSVELTAPDEAGTYRGNWRLSTEAGTIFGDEVYVLIVVGDATATPTVKASASATVQSSATATPTSSATATSNPTEEPTATAAPE